MYFLGISGGVLSGNQDGAAALVKDGSIIAAAEEERFVRAKHASGLLPKRAIQFCLKQAGISIKDVTVVSFAGATYVNFNEILKDYFDFHFGYAPEIVLVDHHLAHAASTYFTWGQDHGLILTMDFSGDRTSTLAAVGEGLNIRELYRLHKPNSLGVFYSMLTQYLGFQKDNDEYKVMGLASYGRPRYDFSKVLFKSGDTYALNSEFVKNNIARNLPAPSKQERLYLNNLSLEQNGRLSDEPITDYYKDVAASGQKALEDIALHLVENLVHQTGIRKLCLAGGVALNCVMNQRIRESGFIDELFVPPHVSDAGLSIGGALLECVKRGIRPRPLEHAYLGPQYT
ncbi:MAG: carbamoyl transferase, partial [Candidatus Omnitrophica bacterium]|nr:carbamoyl transferase [Candidatus Omnitrophota bacterium]